MEEKGKLFGSSSVFCKAELRRRDAGGEAQLAFEKGVGSKGGTRSGETRTFGKRRASIRNALRLHPLAKHPRSQLLPVPSEIESACDGKHGYPGEPGESADRQRLS